MSELSELCDIFSNNVSIENGEKIVSKIDECEIKYSKVKENILKLVKEKSEEENEKEIEGFNLGNGYLIKENKNA